MAPTGRFLRRGTAVHVGGGVFYTSAHVVQVEEDYREFYLATTTAQRRREAWTPAQVACVHPRWRGVGPWDRTSPYDIATLRATGHVGAPALPVDVSVPQPMQPVTIVGFPAASFGWPPKQYVSPGVVDQVWLSDHVFSVVVREGFVLEGSSGSGVLRNGRVVGIVYARAGERDRSAAPAVFAVTMLAAVQGCPPR